MIILDATTTKLQASLGGTVTTTQPDYFASYVDITTTTFVSGQNNGTLNNSTQIDIVPAPGLSNTQRQVKYISIFNRDTASQTVTVVIDVSATDRNLYRGILAPNELLQYVDGEGWSTIDANGNRKLISTSASAANSISYLEPDAIITSTPFQLGSIYLQHVAVPAQFNPDVGMVAMIISNSSSAGGTISINMGAYTVNGASLSLASSTLRTIGYNSATAASSYTKASGTKFWSVPTGTWSMTPGDYIIAIEISSASSGTSGTHGFYYNRTTISMNGSEFGAGTGNVTNPIMWGVYSAASNTLPSSIAFTQVNQTGASNNLLSPWFVLARTS